MDLVVNHTSDEHPWFVEAARVARQPVARLVLVAAAAPARPGDRAPSRTTGSRSSRGSAWELDEATGEYYLHLFSPQAARPELGEPARSAQAVYAMMRWWLDRGVDGFRMDVINLISKDARRCPTAPVAPGGRLRRRRRRAYVNGPRLHEFLAGDEPRGLAPGGDLLTVGEMPGVTVEQSPAVHRPGAPASSTWCSSSSTWTSTQARRRQVGRRRRCDLLRPEDAASRRWQDGLADVGLEQPLLEQPRPAARGVALRRRRPEHRVAVGQDAGHLPAPARGHARTSTRARSSA